MNRAHLATRMSVLEGARVSFRRIAGNRLILYFGGSPGEEDYAYGIGMDPSWRYEQGGAIVVGSADIPWDEADFETPEEFKSTFDLTCNLCDSLIGAAMESVEIAEGSHDLVLRFGHTKMVRTFMNSSSDDGWYFHEKTSGRHYYVSPKEITSRAAV